MKKVGIGLLGFGTVSSGFYNNFEKQREKLRTQLHVDLNIEKIFVRDLQKLPETIRSKGTKRVEDIFENENIQVVVEAINGTFPASDYILKSLSLGKHVITANKAAVAESWQAIHSISNSECYFEASVCGGIPAIEPLKHLSLADDIVEIQGIVNGTTNYILTLMASEGVSYNEALLKAQQLGYAEADPSADVDGIDAANKLSILTAIGFGKYVSPREIPKTSIAGLEKADHSMKVIASVSLENGIVKPKVSLESITENHPLYAIRGVTNVLRVITKQIGEVIFTGPGAGSDPTGTALLLDLIRLVEKKYI